MSAVESITCSTLSNGMQSNYHTLSCHSFDRSSAHMFFFVVQQTNVCLMYRATPQLLSQVITD